MEPPPQEPVPQPSAMDALHEAGIHAAVALQAGPPWLEQFWLLLTSHLDPNSIYTVCFPLARGLDEHVSLMVLWIALVAEWLNVVLKWFLFGERPYWWIYESGMAEREQLPLRQFPVTCETGPGSPSGHCMILGAALWPIVTALSKAVSSRLLRLVPFLLYLLLLAAMGLSRIFVLAHFPHQVISGSLAGMALGWGLQRWPPNFLKVRFFLLTALGLLLSALALHGLATAAGLDLDWFLRRASARCSEPAWLRPETRPWASLCRVSSSALGLALAARHPLSRRAAEELLLLEPTLGSATLGLLALDMLHKLPRSGDSALWYLNVGARYALGPVLVGTLMPQLILTLRRCSGRPPRPPPVSGSVGGICSQFMSQGAPD
ncbi:glucose-6-phosphatase 3 isoform X2 [Camarhynchus parvulus]|uniref:glucose-6-phosphatase 3 isoform X2 n=1 Tax=Geospiza parvula TaxID=87175 RepID=UPI001237F8F5|nr:glucose-6-phosphatase 3 isoform X2 [Camarhynchus parvulus]